MPVGKQWREVLVTAGVRDSPPPRASPGDPHLCRDPHLCLDPPSAGPEPRRCSPRLQHPQPFFISLSFPRLHGGEGWSIPVSPNLLLQFGLDLGPEAASHCLFCLPLSSPDHSLSRSCSASIPTDQLGSAGRRTNPPEGFEGPLVRDLWALREMS